MTIQEKSHILGRGIRTDLRRAFGHDTEDINLTEEQVRVVMYMCDIYDCYGKLRQIREITGD